MTALISPNHSIQWHHCTLCSTYKSQYCRAQIWGWQWLEREGEGWLTDRHQANRENSVSVVCPWLLSTPWRDTAAAYKLKVGSRESGKAGGPHPRPHAGSWDKSFRRLERAFFNLSNLFIRWLFVVSNSSSLLCASLNWNIEEWKLQTHVKNTTLISK